MLTIIKTPIFQRMVKAVWNLGRKLVMPKVAKKMDAEMTAFAADMLESIKQAKRGEAAQTHTPADIAQYKTRGRPVGTLKDDSKQAVTVRYSPDVLNAFRATGAGWQARMNDALRDWLNTHSPV
jgi:uncharacterized protein (DUF4415 family)